MKRVLLGAVLVATSCRRGSAPAVVDATPPSVSSTVTVASAPSGSSAPSTSAATASAPIVVRFDAETKGDPSPAFKTIVGDWRIAAEAGATGLKIDGARWSNGMPMFPVALWNGGRPPGDVRVSVRFFPLAGKVDQAAGIVFATDPDGSYWAVRANALEDNVLFFHVVADVRTVLDRVASVPTPTKTWHTLEIELRGRTLTATVDGTKRLENALAFTPVGRLGLWSKADSQVLFDDFTVAPL